MQKLDAYAMSYTRGVVIDGGRVRMERSGEGLDGSGGPSSPTRFGSEKRMAMHHGVRVLAGGIVSEGILSSLTRTGPTWPAGTHR